MASSPHSASSESPTDAAFRGGLAVPQCRGIDEFTVDSSQSTVFEYRSPESVRECNRRRSDESCGNLEYGIPVVPCGLERGCLESFCRKAREAVNRMLSCLVDAAIGRQLPADRLERQMMTLDVVRDSGEL